MAERKRKDGYPLEIFHIREDPRILIERNEILRLTKMAKSWEFTCSFCFKKFPSAQAMGGHQNAHRSERLEEKRLFVRDPIGYRKRAYLRSVRAESSTIGGGSNTSLSLRAPTGMVTNDLPKPNNLLGHGFGAFNASANGTNYFCQQSTSKDSPVVDNNGENLKALPFAVMNFLPPKELSLADGVGTVHAEDAKGKKCIELSIGGYDQTNMGHKLDLTLKL